MKKFLSLILALVMMLALALPVFAAEDKEIIDWSVSSVQQIHKALNTYAGSKEINITLEDDILEADTINFKPGVEQTIRINLNGHKMKASLINIFGKATVVIYDDSKNPGTFECTSVINNSTLITKDIVACVGYMSNKGALYLSGNQGSRLALIPAKDSITFVGKDVKLEGALNLFDNSVAILEAKSLKEEELPNVTSEPKGTLLLLDFNGGSIDFDTFTSYAKNVKEANVAEKSTIDLPTVTRGDWQFIKWVDENNDAITSIPTKGIVKAAVIFEYKDGIKFDANGGTCDCEAMTLNYDGLVIGELPAAEKVGVCFDGWYLGDTKVEASTVLEPGTTLKAKWISVADNSSKITKALQGVGFSKADIEKILDLFKNDNVAGSMLSGRQGVLIAVVALLVGAGAGVAVKSATDKKKNKK